MPDSEAWSVAYIMGAGKRGLECGLYQGCRKARLGVWLISWVPESKACDANLHTATFFRFGFVVDRVNNYITKAGTDHAR